MRLLQVVALTLTLILTLSVQGGICWFEGWYEKGLGALQAGAGMLEGTFNEYTGSDFIRSFFKLVFKLDVTSNPPEQIRLPTPTQLQLVPLEDLEHYVHFAAATYCEGDSLQKFTCNECKLTGSAVEIVQVIKNGSLNTQAFVTTDSLRREVVLAFRGKRYPQNWMVGFSIDMITSPLGDGAKIHKGSYEMARSLHGQVLYLVKRIHRNHQDYRVVLTGHSLGGVVATMEYYLLSAELPDVSYALVTFGEPRGGDQLFADILNARSIPSARVVNGGDVVPHIPPWSLGFVHYQTEYWTNNGITKICSNEFYEDASCSNSLPSTGFRVSDHLSYLGTNLGYNCIDENPIQGILGFVGK